MNKWIAEFELEDGDTMPEHMNLNYMGGKIDFHCRPMWIPVSERLPEANGRYLVTRGLNACGALWNRIYIVNYSDLMGLKPTKIWWNGNVGKSDFETYNDILAWMPLPEHYKESEENNG